jgi:transcriptional/translational regulatory protein YebC/TACO1
VLSEPSAFEAVKRALEQQSIPTVLAEVSMVPKTTVKLEGKAAEQMVRMMEELEEHDDVQKVWANFDIADEVMEKVAAGP